MGFAAVCFHVLLMTIEIVTDVILMLQLNEDDADNLADDVNADDCDEQPAEEVTVSPVKTKKKRKKKAKDKYSSDAKALVPVFLLFVLKTDAVIFFRFLCRIFLSELFITSVYLYLYLPGVQR